ADGGPITPRDVKVDQSQNPDPDVQVAAFFHYGVTPGTSRTLVASAEIKLPKPHVVVVASLGGEASPNGSTRPNVSLTTEPDPSLTDPNPFPPARVASLSRADS